MVVSRQHSWVGQAKPLKHRGTEEAEAEEIKFSNPDPELVEGEGPYPYETLKVPGATESLSNLKNIVLIAIPRPTRDEKIFLCFLLSSVFQGFGFR